MKMRKINNKKVCYFLCLFVLYAFLSAYSIMTSKLIYLCSDWYVLKLLICLSIVFYTFCALLTLIVSNKVTKNGEGLKLYFLFIFSGLPIGIFLFNSQYINRKIFIIYVFINIFIIFLSFCAKKIAIDCFFVPGLVLVIAFGCINNSLDNTNISMIIPIEHLAVEYESNIIEKVDRIAFKGTFGTYLEQTIYTNDNNFDSHTYVQFESNNKFFLDLFAIQYYNENMITIKDNKLFNVIYNCEDTYIINLKNNNIIYILKTSRKPNEIDFYDNLVLYP